tara:strand:+ start:19956 stop:25478 length:5523 start_codon:yes stop_codon:yes gene_type:complete
MAEVKNSFIKSKMNKDLDARLLPNGEYREGINIQVSKSEGADVGALENVLGNIEIQDYKSISGCNCDLETIGFYTDEVSTNIYIFLTDYDETLNTASYTYTPQSLNYSSTANNYVYVYNVATGVSIQLLSGAFLNFSKNKPIIGVNLLENILFWTDNRNQPRRIDITKEAGYYTTEDQISVATYAPFQPINLYYKRESAFLPNGGSAITDGITSTGSSTILLTSANRLGIAAGLGTDPKTLVGSTITAVDANGVAVPGIPANSVLQSFANGNQMTIIDVANIVAGTPLATVTQDIPSGTTIYFNQNTLTNISTPSYYVTSMLDASSKMNPGGTYNDLYPGLTTNANYNPKFNGDPDFLEDKFVKFSYRFKYDTGEYSIMAPFTQAAFIPKQDGYFLTNTSPSGMTQNEQSTYRSTVVDFMENKVNNIILQIPTPLDENNNHVPANELFTKLKIEEIEILYKESDALAVQVVDAISFQGTGGYAELGGAGNVIPYNYQSTKPYKTLPESELTRVYDKSPVRALGQEIISNRVVYSNFQNKHTPPETLNYNVAVSEKYTNFITDDPTVPAPLYKTSSREYPMHTIKQNRNYQVGVVLSDKYGRSSTTILSSATSQGTDEDDLTLLGDTIYFPYNTVSSTNNTLNNINTWPGDSIKVLFNAIVPEFQANTQNGWPGLYNGDPTSASYNPLGWYSYKIVVKQTEQEYYNVYLPGLMNFYPAFSAPGDNPDVAGSVSYITLLNDNINKVPRDLTEVGPEQKQFRSSVRLFGRVAPSSIAQPLNNYQFNPVNTATNIALPDTVATISDQNDLFDNTTNIKFGSIYQTVSNPSMARVSISQSVGSTEPAANTTAVNTWLSIYETIPTESRLDIYWETSTTGTIAELNEAIQTTAGIKGFTTDTSSNPPSTWTFNLFEDIAPGQSPNVSYAGSYATAVAKPFFPYTEDAAGLKTVVQESNIAGAVATSGATMPTTQQPGFQVVNNNGEDVSNKFKLVKNANTSPISYQIFINNSYFYFGEQSLDNDSFTFTFEVENLDGNASTNPNFGTKTILTFDQRLLNKSPIIQNCPATGVVGTNAGDTDLFTLNAVNGTADVSKQYDDLTWGIAYGLNQTSGFTPTIPASPTEGLPEIKIVTGSNGSATIKDESGLLNVGYPITVAVTDAGAADTTYPLPNGNPTTTCSFTINGSNGYESDVLNADFYAAKNVAINLGSESSIFGWGQSTSPGFYDPSTIGWPQNIGTVTPVFDGVGSNPTTGGVVFIETTPANACDPSVTSQLWSFYNTNRNANIRTSVPSGPAGAAKTGLLGLQYGQKSDQVSSAAPGTPAVGLKSGTAYIVIDYDLNNYNDIPTGGSGRYQPSVIWPTKLQYRENGNDPWSDAYDVEGKLIQFGGSQINNQNITPSLNSSFKNTGIIDKSNEARDSDQNFGVADAFQCTYTGQQDGGSIEVNTTGRKIFAIGRNSAYRESNGQAPSSAPDRYGEYRLIVRYPYGDNITSNLANVPPMSQPGFNQGNRIIPTYGVQNYCPGMFAQQVEVRNYMIYSNALANQQVYLSYGDFYNPEQLLNTYNNLQGVSTKQTSVSNPVSYEYRISDAYDTREMAACQTPGTLVYAREWSFRYISQLFTDPALTSAYVPGTTGDKFFSYSGVNDTDLNVVYGNENCNSENGGAPLPASSSSSRKWTAQFNNTGKKIMQTAEPCIGNSSLNTSTNFRSISDAQRLPCSTPAGGVQYGTMNINNMTSPGNNEFIATFTETTSSFQTLMNLLTGITAVKNVSYNITSSSDSLLIFEGNSPYSQLLDITLDVSSTGGTKVIWQRFGNRDSIRFNNSITDLSTIGFPSNPSNFYWVVS